MNTLRLALALWLLGGSSLYAGPPSAAGGDDADRFPSSEEAESPMPPMTNYNLKFPTLGGRQFWGDVVNFRGWRIQQHVYSRHFRLLDPKDIRHAWGSREQCEAELERIKAEQKLPPLSGRAAILIHGILRSSKAFSRMKTDLVRAGYVVVPFDYPSTQVPIPESAKYLAEVIETLDGVEQIDLVVHSMGGLIVRSYLQQAGESIDARLHRMVMLGVPNLGARMANIVQTNLMFRTVFGPAGQQLIEAEDGLIASLPAPEFEFAVVAGSRGRPEGYNPLIPGDDDGVVSVESACLPGACDSLLVECVHSFLPSNETVIAATLRFLDTGLLRVDEGARPIRAGQP